MTLEAAVQALTAKINENYLKTCEIESKLDGLIDRIGLIENASAMLIAYGQVSTAPFYVGNNLNSGYVPSFTLVTNQAGVYPGSASLAARVSIEQNQIRALYQSFQERLDDFFGAYSNNLPSQEPVVPFYQPDSASAYAVSAMDGWIPEMLLPVIGASEFYEGYLRHSYTLLTRFGYRDLLDVELIVPPLFDVSGNLIEVEDSGGALIPANISRLVSKRIGIQSNTGVQRASNPVGTAWVGYVKNLKTYVGGLP